MLKSGYPHFRALGQPVMHLLQVYDIYDTAQLRSHRVGAHVYNMQEYLYKFINFVRPGTAGVVSHRPGSREARSSYVA